MILVFEALGSFIYVKIDEKRQIHFSGPHTDYKFISLRKLCEDTNQSLEEVDLIEEIAKGLVDEKKLQKYIISEFGRLGFSFTKNIEEEEYVKLCAN